jgi:hypothetical protein
MKIRQQSKINRAEIKKYQHFTVQKSAYTENSHNPAHTTLCKNLYSRINKMHFCFQFIMN